jgi:hypothetical protein
MSSYEPIIKNGVMIFELEKPIYNSTFAIWDKWLKMAKDKHYKMVVVTSFGTSTYPTYKEWLIGAKKIERFYKNPNEPMIFYSRDVMPDVKAREVRKKAEKAISENVGLSQVLANAPEDEKARLEALRAKLGLKP